MAEPMKRLPALPAERALKVIAGRWKPIILYHLFEGSLRLSQLQRLFPECLVEFRPLNLFFWPSPSGNPHIPAGCPGSGPGKAGS